MRECQALGNNLNNEEKIRFEDFLSKEQSLFDTITTEYDYLDEICKELHTDEVKEVIEYLYVPVRDLLTLAELKC